MTNICRFLDVDYKKRPGQAIPESTETAFAFLLLPSPHLRDQLFEFRIPDFPPQSFDNFVISHTVLLSFSVGSTRLLSSETRSRQDS
jgi:hypothetical protein